MKVKDYRQICQKNEQENYFIDKFIVRKLSIYFTIFFIKFGVEANTATFLSLAAALGSLYFLTLNCAAGIAAATVLIFVYYMLDHVDGELARYYIKQGLQLPSLKGHYLDVLVHRYSSNLMVFFLGVGVYNFYGYEWAVLVGFVAFVGISSFPNVVAAQVLAGKIAREPGAVFEDKNVILMLADQEKKSRQVEDVQRGSAARKLQKVLIETLFFPGHIILLMAVLLGDIFFDGFYVGDFGFNLRLVFIAVMAFLYTLKTVAQSLLWMKKFGGIK